jgi:hypothetical protein
MPDLSADHLQHGDKLVLMLRGNLPAPVSTECTFEGAHTIGGEERLVFRTRQARQIHLYPRTIGWVDGYGHKVTIVEHQPLAARDELARLIFTLDNDGAADPDREWELAVKAGMVAYAYRVADGLITSGYTK